MECRTEKEQLLVQVLASAETVCGFRTSLNAETDRGCALMAASYLDSEIERLLKGHLVAQSKVVDALFEPSGPLGAFSARVDLAFSLGLLDTSTHRELHLVRKIRNEFGHSYEPLSFDTDAIKNRCNELNRIPRDSQEPRHLFTRTVMGLLAVVHAQLLRTTQHRVPVDHITQDRQSIEMEVEKVKNHFAGMSSNDDSRISRLWRSCGNTLTRSSRENR